MLLGAMQLLANHRPAYLTVSLIRRPHRLERLLASRPLAQPSDIHYGVKQSPGSKLEMAKIHARGYSSGLMRRPGQAEATRFIHHFRSIAATGIRRGWQGINTAPPARVALHCTRKSPATQKYTQFSIRISKQVHAMTHLAELQKPEPLSKEEASSGDLSTEEMFAAW